MRKRPASISHPPAALRLRRREALKGLGALAISTPALAMIGCGGDSAQSASGEAGSGASVSSPSAAAGSSAANGTGGASAGNNASTTAQPGNGSTPAGSAGVSGGGRNSSAAGSGPGASGATGNAGASGGSAGAGAGTAGTGTDTTRPSFDDAASCMLTTTDIEGPFFIDDHEVPNDISLVRSDIREGLPGVECRFYFRLLDAKNKCAPIPDAEIYIWHCNADGYYSGFADQDPSKAYTGAADRTPENLDRFCRGVQSSDGDGVAAFTTVYPGWYAGRPIHVHLVARLNGATTRMITTQLYFAAAFTKEVHESEPAYMARAASIPAGSLNPPAGKPAMPSMKHTPGLVTGTLNVIVNRG